MAFIVTARVTAAPYDSGRYTHPITTYTITGNGTTAVDIVAHGDVVATTMLVAIEGHVSVSAACQIHFISKPTGTGLEIAWLEFPARGTLPIPAFYCQPGEGLQFNSETSVSVYASIAIAPIAAGRPIPVLS